MDILGQSSLLVAVTSFALGFSNLARNVRNKLFLAFAVVCTLISIWALSFFLEKVWGGGTFYRFHLAFNIWLAPVSIGFIRVMVRIQDGLSRRLFDLSLIGALALSIALLFRFESIEWVRQCIYFLPALVVVQTLRLMWIDKRLRHGIKRLPKVPTVGLAKRNLIYIGALLVLSFSVMDHVPLLGKVFPSIGNVCLTFYLFFISQAISQQRFLNLGALFSRFLVLLVVALTLTILYSVLVAWIENSPGLFFLNSFIASFLILMLLDPLRKAVSYLTQRLLTQQHRRLEQTLREAQRKLAGIVDPGALFQNILLTLEQTLQPENASLFVLRADGTRFRRARTVGQDSSESVRELLADHPLLDYCEKLYKKGELPILLDQMLESEMDRTASREQREFFVGLREGLKALKSNLLIPLIESDQILGFVVASASSPPEPWGNNWGILQILYPFFEQAALILRNMDIYARQKEKERLAALGEMSAGLAHEIRNPLSAIRGAAQYLNPAGNHSEDRFLRIIVDEVDRLNHVVTQFLDYAKSSLPEVKKVDLSLLTERAIEKMKPGLPEAIHLEFHPSSMPAWIMASPEQIQQVLLNLVQNSVKALEGRKESRVKISIVVEGIGKYREVVLTAEDNGVGIKRENLDKIFIPFFTTSPSGTGLGLPICQKIIENNHGRIEVASEEGRYTRMSVILPYFQES